jgi:hypothetical protein
MCADYARGMSMRELIYYPSFEVQNREWLKFALLYFQKLDPIIPESGDIHLTDEYKMVVNETDLIQKHRPDYEEGERATLDAIDQIERILRHPEAFIGIFSEKKFIQKWKNPKERTVTLFKEKYIDYWERFCLENKLAERSNHGLRISPDVANIYMTILAQCVADSRGVSTITDERFLDRFSIFSRKAIPNTANTTEAAQGIINLKLPVNLKDLSIDAIINHRNKQNFKQLQMAFHTELERFLGMMEQSNENCGFERSLGNIWSDFSDEIVQIGSGTVAFGLGVWLLFQSGGTALLPAWEKLAGGAALTVGSVISVRNTWKNTRTRRMARRYLADMQDLALVTG